MQVGFLRAQLPGDVTADVAMSRLREQSLVASAERNYIVETTLVPNDARWHELWGMEMIGAPAA
jgi:hypothetical protein